MNLTPKQMKILHLFLLQGQMGIMRLATLMQCEKALARNMVDELVRLGLLVRYENTQYNISAAGKARLPAQHAEQVAAERKAKKTPSNKTTFKVVEEDHAPARKPVTVAAPVPETAAPVADDAGFTTDDNGVAALVDAVVEPAPVPEPVKPTFDDLVLAGLNRLAEQLHFSPVQIEHKRRKLSTLTKLAEAVAMFDKPVAEVLYAIATDLNKLPEVKHG